MCWGEKKPKEPKIEFSHLLKLRRLFSVLGDTRALFFPYISFTTYQRASEMVNAIFINVSCWNLLVEMRFHEPTLSNIHVIGFKSDFIEFYCVFLCEKFSTSHTPKSHSSNGAHKRKLLPTKFNWNCLARRLFRIILLWLSTAQNDDIKMKNPWEINEMCHFVWNLFPLRHFTCCGSSSSDILFSSAFEVISRSEQINIFEGAVVVATTSG